LAGEPRLTMLLAIMGRSPGTRLLYLAYEFPVLTQTFTIAEATGLARAGFDVTVLSCRPSREERILSGPPTEVLPHPLSAGSFGALLFFLVRRPVRTLSLIGHLLTARYRDQALRCRARGFLQFLWGVRLALRIRKERPGPHLHAQFVDAASTVAWVAARLADATFSVTNHTAYNPYVLGPKLRDAARFFSISEFDRKLLLRMAGVEDAAALRVVRQGVDLGQFERRGPKTPGAPAEILSVAALREKKGHHVLIRAAARLRDEGNDFRLTIVGEGPERERLTSLIADLALEGRVRLVGAETPARVRERLGGADLYALACTTSANGDLDGIPISLMEAMATGVPVVSTRLSGVPELIEDGEEGLLAAPDDPEGLAAAMASLLDDRGRAERLADGARRKVENEYEIGASVAALARELREVTG